MDKITKKQAEEELAKGYSKAEKLVEDDEKMERFLQRLEKKLKVIPVGGSTLSMVPTLVSLLDHYRKKEYKKIPIGSIIAIVSALIYFLAPVDLIPDYLAFIGYIDDASVIAACIKLIGDDVKEYQKWREENHKIIEDA